MGSLVVSDLKMEDQRDINKLLKVQPVLVSLVERSSHNG